MDGLSLLPAIAPTSGLIGVAIFLWQKGRSNGRIESGVSSLHEKTDANASKLDKVDIKINDCVVKIHGLEINLENQDRRLSGIEKSINGNHGNLVPKRKSRKRSQSQSQSEVKE